MKQVIAGTLIILSLALNPGGAVPQTGAQALATQEEQARTLLKEGMDSKDYTVRVEAITAAGMIGVHEQVVQQLEGFLHDKDYQVRLAAIQALTDLEAPDSLEPLRQTLRQDPTPEVAFAAAKALEKMHDPEGTQALREIFDGKRKASAGTIRKEERGLTSQFHSLPAAMMFMVSRGIGYVPLPGVGEGFSAVTKLLRDPQFSDRAAVVLILGQDKNPAADDLLHQALKDEDWTVRAAAVQIIAHTARMKWRDQLPPLFEDKSHKVRFRAAGAFLHLALLQYSEGKPKDSLKSGAKAQ